MHRTHSLSISLRTVRFFILAALACAVFAWAQPAHADHAWGNYHWSRTSNTFTVKLGDNLTASWDAYLATASSDWSASTVLDTTVAVGNTNDKRGRNTPKNCTPTSGRVEVCNASYGSTGWLGIATVWASGNHITQGTVKLNDTYFKTSKYNTPAWKQFVMCQEIGHTFGLAHQDEGFNNLNRGSCMDYTNNPERNDGSGDNQHPNQHDFDQLIAIYADHLDGSTTLRTATTPAAANTDAEPASEQIGRAARAPREARVSRFERDLGNGDKVFTFVVWADDAEHHDHDQ